MGRGAGRSSYFLSFFIRVRARAPAEEQSPKTVSRYGKTRQMPSLSFLFSFSLNFEFLQRLQTVVVTAKYEIQTFYAL